MEEALVFYDGQCGLCRKSVVRAKRFVKAASARFVESSTPEAKAVLEPLGLAASAADMLIVVVGGKAFAKSDAALQVAHRFRWPWRAASAARIVPRRWRDALYDRVARNRNRDACVMPLPEA